MTESGYLDWGTGAFKFNFSSLLKITPNVENFKVWPGTATLFEIAEEFHSTHYETETLPLIQLGSRKLALLSEGWIDLIISHPETRNLQLRLNQLPMQIIEDISESDQFMNQDMFKNLNGYWVQHTSAYREDFRLFKKSDVLSTLLRSQQGVIQRLSRELLNLNF